MASEAAASSNSPTWVRIGRRAAGGVLTIDRSRMPVSAISSVRGMGLAVRVSTSTPSAHRLDRLLVGDPEALLLVDHQQARAS